MSMALALTSDVIFTDELYVNFTNLLREQVTLSMYDASGRLVKTFYQGQSEKTSIVYILYLS